VAAVAAMSHLPTEKMAALAAAQVIMQPQDHLLVQE
jgi:hypothetical protein